MNETIIFNKDSDLSKLPEDLLINPQYGVKVYNPELKNLCKSYALNIDVIIHNIMYRDFVYFVEGIEEKPDRTHEEIMTNWFRRDESKNWFRVVAYNYNREEYIGYSYLMNTEAFAVNHFTKEDFTDFEMSELPPE